MKKGLLSLVAIIALSSSAIADDMYVKVGAGYTLSEENSYSTGVVDTDAGYSLSLAVGKDIDNYSVELEYGYMNADYYNKTSDYRNELSSKALFLNGYYNFMKEKDFSPYVGAGIGYADYSDGASDGKDIAYQGMLGLNYDVAEQTSVYAEYRYRYLDVNDFTAISKIDTNEFILGVKYSF